MYVCVPHAVSTGARRGCRTLWNFVCMCVFGKKRGTSKRGSEKDVEGKIVKHTILILEDVIMNSITL